MLSTAVDGATLSAAVMATMISMVAQGDEDTLFGEAGDDRYFFSENDGRDIITDTEGQNTLLFGIEGRSFEIFGNYANIGEVVYSEDDFDFARDGDDLVISTDKGNEVVIQEYAETSFSIYFRDAGGDNQELLVPEGLF